MSLILDALRKAEAERQRGVAPGLQNVAAAPPPRPQARRPGRGLGTALALGLLLVGALVAWRMLPAPTVPSSRPVAEAPAAPAPPATPAPATTTSPVPAPLPRVVSAPPAAPVGTQPATPPSPTPPLATPARPVAAAPILTQVRRLAELPPEQRRELPPLVVGGSVWSEQATARFVVLDGQVLREGDAAAPGLVLVKLAPRAATLRWRDTLIEVPF